MNRLPDSAYRPEEPMELEADANLILFEILERRVDLDEYFMRKDIDEQIGSKGDWR